ncbi:hypothetical protein BaRGS_00010264 [Batillaria attramentaria]|uniref:U3 small nucleolar RNA-associated protein 6 homolog C-terminal domain-containing protein n=1 Tax=Batillaria attramentaria TaxID=370345 RepID=A0ABD0LGI5_9CAEN
MIIFTLVSSECRRGKALVASPLVQPFLGVELHVTFAIPPMAVDHSVVKMKNVRRAFEDAVTDFGRSEPDVWLRYIKMELHTPGGEALRAGQLHSRAIQSLPGSLLTLFIQQYNATSDIPASEAE